METKTDTETETESNGGEHRDEKPLFVQFIF